MSMLNTQLGSARKVEMLQTASPVTQENGVVERWVVSQPGSHKTPGVAGLVRRAASARR